MYNTHSFSTATIAARTRLNVTLYVHCLSCYIKVHNAKLLQATSSALLTLCEAALVGRRAQMDAVKMFCPNRTLYVEDKIKIRPKAENKAPSWFR